MHPLPFPYPCPCPSQVLSAKDDGLTASDEAAVEALYAGVAQAHIEALGLEAQALLAQARQGQGQGQGRAVEEADPRQPSLSLASTSTSEYFGLLYTRSAASRAPLDAILHCLCTDPNPLYRSGAREWVNELCQDIARRVSVPGMHHKVRGLGGPRGEGPAPLATMACLHADLAHSNIPPPPPPCPPPPSPPPDGPTQGPGARHDQDAPELRWRLRVPAGRGQGGAGLHRPALDG